jgi:hypothetical protein
MQHPLDRALTILATAFPATPRETFATLSIGRRDSYLLGLRELTFGPQLNSYAECSQCQERLEFTLPVANLRVAETGTTAEQPYELTVEDHRLSFRLPDSRDLAATVACKDTVSARQVLLERCVLQATRDDSPVPVRELPAGVIERLAAQMAVCDPQAEIVLNLRCPACDHGWQVLFDIVTFFWAEIAAQAKRLLHEVHLLARAYAWAEADILAMSAWRRECYLNMVGA